MKKILYIVLDGLGDLPIAELSNKTPLEAALTPNLDRLAQNGKTGIVDPVAKGVAPESDTAVISLLGYEALKDYAGRGSLESLAEGVELGEGDVALRINFATVGGDKKTIIDRRVGRNLSEEEAAGLTKEINSKVTLSGATFEFRHTIGHRGILVLRGMRSKLSSWISNTDPAYQRCGGISVVKENFENVVGESKVLAGHEDSSEAGEAAAILNEFTLKSWDVLNNSQINKKRIEEKKSPANILLARDAADRLPQLASLNSLFGVKFGSFVQMPIERGIAILTGMDIIGIPSSTGHVDVDYQVWAKIALDSLGDYGCIYVHIKGPDEPGHDGDFNKKKEIIEMIDKFFFGDLLSGLDLESVIAAVTADHTTSCAKKAHTADPVPLVICGGSIKPDGSMSFSEKAARSGSIGEIEGRDILPLLVTSAKN